MIFDLFSSLLHCLGKFTLNGNSSPPKTKQQQNMCLVLYSIEKKIPFWPLSTFKKQDQKGILRRTYAYKHSYTKHSLGSVWWTCFCYMYARKHIEYAVCVCFFWLWLWLWLWFSTIRMDVWIYTECATHHYG